MKCSMEDTETDHNTQRRYDAEGRRRRAAEQREAALLAAGRLFLEQGYPATTVDVIAREAGVSSATVYKTYGGKAGLVRELCQRALAGAGPVPAETRSDALRGSGDARAIVGGWGRLAAEVSPRISPLVRLLRIAAESDSEAEALYAELSTARFARMTDNARHLLEAGHLRTGVTLEQARDVLWFCTSEDVHDLLCVQRGWSAERFGEFVADTIAGSLL